MEFVDACTVENFLHISQISCGGISVNIRELSVQRIRVWGAGCATQIDVPCPNSATSHMQISQ
jgi:hypothetical protein